MGVKKINGDLNVTGTIMKNGSELLPRLELVGTTVSKTLVPNWDESYMKWTGFHFSGVYVNNAVKPGIYILTYGNAMIFLPIGNIQLNTKYRVNGVVCTSDGGYKNVIITYGITGGYVPPTSEENFDYHLVILEAHGDADWENSIYPSYIPEGYTGYLFRVPINI